VGKSGRRKSHAVKEDPRTYFAESLERAVAAASNSRSKRSHTLMAGIFQHRDRAYQRDRSV
jgi:hypothetical protein